GHAVLPFCAGGARRRADFVRGSSRRLPRKRRISADNSGPMKSDRAANCSTCGRNLAYVFVRWLTLLGPGENGMLTLAWTKYSDRVAAVASTGCGSMFLVPVRYTSEMLALAYPGAVCTGAPSRLMPGQRLLAASIQPRLRARPRVAFSPAAG